MCNDAFNLQKVVLPGYIFHFESQIRRSLWSSHEESIVICLLVWSLGVDARPTPDNFSLSSSCFQDVFANRAAGYVLAETTSLPSTAPRKVEPCRSNGKGALLRHDVIREYTFLFPKRAPA